ncbi:rod shape-determining protein MreC [Sulfurovum sp.]|uniref:rod shape-determining protein MreC n=1 Tax=Sulfurovum sp. TaxID=1969726 RepID=UPI0025D7D8F5|nr:rod shape-determining protein MreC [Sulfurovum sp.]
MKTRLVIIVILLLILTVLLTRNDERIADTLLGIINPIKQNYKSISQDIEDKSHSYIFQKESIEKLSKENRILRKLLLEQTHYIKQIKNIYEVFPKLSRLPVHNISIAETISYVKLNSFSQIILTKPKALTEGKLYGLIQGTVVAGTAKVHNNQLYGYLTSDDKCRFSVFIGKDQAPGIAMGVEQNEMIIKFIPKWHKVNVGEKVVTSGLDDIFFAGIPVGVVQKVEIQSSYKVAHIKTYSDIFHPKTFFLINNAKPTLAQNFDSNATHLPKPAAAQCIPASVIDNNRSVAFEQNQTEMTTPEHNQTLPIISSIPNRIDQTQEDIIEPEAEVEQITPPAPVKKAKKRKIRKKRKPKPKPRPSSLDLF